MTGIYRLTVLWSLQVQLQNQGLTSSSCTENKKTALRTTAQHLEGYFQPYFIKNPVCICNGSADDHVYPLRVVFI